MNRTLSIRNPDVESLIRGLPSTGSDDWDAVRPWALSLIRDRNAWSIKAKGRQIRNLNSMGRKPQ